VDGDGDVFKALADPARRQLLDALYERDGQTLAELCERLPDMTRFGVMKHLGVLEGANVVTSFKHGRSKLHYLNPVPIREIHDRWISKYAAAAADTLAELKTAVEAGTNPRPAVRTERKGA
jgi:DNA-binding transcriptional ArsR family regulator